MKFSRLLLDITNARHEVETYALHWVGMEDVPVPRNFLLSRSGITSMGLELAEHLGVTLIARAKGRHFLVYSGKDNLIYDEIPKRQRETDRINS